MRRFTVDESSAGLRADVFVAGKFPDFTRSSLKELFRRQLVRVNGAVIKSSHHLRPQEKVSVDDTLLKIPAPTVKLPVLYEDDHLIVINKPAGLLTHAKGAINLEPTVASSLRDKVSAQLKGNRAGVVHRLDRGTSGVLVVAKDHDTLSYLQKQFTQRLTKKRYQAIVEGTPRPAQALIDVPIARNPRQPQTFTVSRDGKPAQTNYKVTKQFKRGDKIYSLIELEPITGRTHQLRVHLKYIGHPVAGDRVYGHGGTDLMLHATSLGLALPGGKEVNFYAPTPKRFKEFSGNR